MEKLKKLKIKNILILAIIIFIFLVLGNKYQKYKLELKNKEQLIENKKNIEGKIEEVVEEKNKQKQKIKSEYEQIQMISGKISILSMKSESDFKKMIYVFSKQSDLKMKEISKSETIWERNGYKLKYIHFTLDGSLNDFGKFLYFINKSKKFIDTSKMFINLTAEGFKISLGFIEKIKVES